LPLQAAEVEAFLDGLVAAQLEAYTVPGATVSVVQDGELLFAKGYGYADLATRKPVVAEQTLFRPGSVSKLFIWTAVMQLVEQGQLDLDADVNTYLTRFKIPATYVEPITLAHLLAHTPGFEDLSEGLFLRSAEDLLPLEEYLIAYMPARVRPPGVITAYSNYGTALAGYIIAQVAGVPYEQYLEEQIFQPLQMTRSTFRQPLPAELAGDMAVGYTLAAGWPEPRFFEVVHASPAGALSATATDLANFMIAHLQQGRFGDARILEEATARQMQQQLFTNDPRVNGFAHGFFEAALNGERLLWHGGDTIFFHSALVLLPEHNLGYFISYNGLNGSLAVFNTMRAFMDHYFPLAVEAPPTPPPSALAEAQRVAGSYVMARSNQSMSEKVANLFQMVDVQPTTAGEIIVSIGTPAQLAAHYVAREALVYAPVDAPPSIFGDVVFRADAQGNITHLFQQNNPSTGYFRAPWYAATTFNFLLLGFCLFLFLATIIGGLAAIWIRWRYHEQRSWAAQLAAWSAGLLSLAGVAFLLIFTGTVSNVENIAFGLPTWFDYLMLLPWVVVVLAVVMLILTPVVWALRFWSLPRRLHYTLLLAASAVFVWWLYFWNLLVWAQSAIKGFA
jgi:CubicO group peptidase (beta-lactamase class C family)